MFSKIGEDRWIWICLGIVTFCTVRVVSHHLQQIRDITKVDDDDQGPTKIDRTTEEALSLETLKRLADAPVYELRLAATKIICERAVSGPTYSLLLQNVASADPQERAIALVALKYLCKSSFFLRLINYPTFHALVTALAHSLEDPSRTDYHHRPPPERHAMQVMSVMLPHDIQTALKAGVVKRWLAHYPFGRTEAEIHEAVKKLRSYAANDQLLASIIGVLENHPEGRKQMRLAGLTGSSMSETEDDDNDKMLGVEFEVGMESLATRRPREDTPEERMIRRRRREAIVVSDGRQPLGRADIIQRWGPGQGDDGSVERGRSSEEEVVRD